MSFIYCFFQNVIYLAIEDELKIAVDLSLKVDARFNCLRLPPPPLPFLVLRGSSVFSTGRAEPGERKSDKFGADEAHYFIMFLYDTVTKLLAA